MPTVGFHASHDLEALIKERAASAKKKVSTYLAPIVDKAVRGPSDTDAMSPRVLSELTRRLCGENAERLMNERLGNKSQSLELESILRHYLAHGAEPTMREQFAEMRRFIFELAQEHLDAALQGKPPKRQGKAPLSKALARLEALNRGASAASESSKPTPRPAPESKQG